MPILRALLVLRVTASVQAANIVGSPELNLDSRISESATAMDFLNHSKHPIPQGVQVNRNSICAKLYSQWINDGKNKKNIS